MSARDQRIQAADSLLQGPLHPLEESQRHVLWHSRWRNATEFGSFGLRNHLQDIDSSGIFIDFPRCPSQKAHKSHTLLAVDDHLSPEEPMPAMLRIALRKVEAFHRAGIPLQLISEDPEIVGDVLLHACCAPYSWILRLVCYRSLVILLINTHLYSILQVNIGSFEVYKSLGPARRSRGPSLYSGPKAVARTKKNASSCRPPAPWRPAPSPARSSTSRALDALRRC